MKLSIAKNGAYTLLAFLCMTNANGLGYMLLGLNQLGSILILVAIAFLLVNPKRPRYCLSTPGVCFVFSVALYLFLGTIYTIFNQAEQVDKFLLTYGSSLLVIYATANYVSNLHGREQQLYAIKVVAWCGFLGVSSVFFSDTLFQIYANPPASLDRSSGFFANANEAGISALITLSLMLWLHQEQKKYIYLIGALISVAALFLTFSKSSMSGLFIILFVYLAGRRKLGGLILVGVFVAIAGLVLTSPELFFDDLLDSQAKRIEQVFKIMTGNIDSDVTTGRTVLWEKGLSMAAENSFIFGDGLGSFHSFKGMYFDYGDEVGVHNTYFMMLGEAGSPVALAFLLSNILIAYALYRAGFLYLLMYFIVLQIDFFSAHNIIGLRFHNLLLGFLFGALAFSDRFSKKSGGNCESGMSSRYSKPAAGGLPFSNQFS